MHSHSDQLVSKQDLVNPLTYGSSIILTVPQDPKAAIFLENFIQPNLSIIHLEENASTGFIDNKYPEYSFSLFKILPFSSADNFKWQERILTDFLDEDKKGQSLAERLNSKERKKEFEDLIQSFDLEFNSNLLLFEKMKGSPIFFESSVFQLLHCETLRYLSLNNDNPNDIK